MLWVFLMVSFLLIFILPWGYSLIIAENSSALSTLGISIVIAGTFLAAATFYRTLSELVKLLLHPSAVELDPTPPYVGDYRQWDFSLYVLMFILAGMLCFFPVISIFLSRIIVPAWALTELVEIFAIFCASLIAVFGIEALSEYFSTYRGEKSRRQKILRHLVEKMHSAPKSECLYYWTMYAKIEEAGWMNVGSFAKIVGILSTLIAAVPTLLQMLTPVV